MGSISESDWEEYAARLPVKNRWQRTYLSFYWGHAGNVEDFMMRTLYFTYCKDKPRLTNIEEECNRFWKHNKTFVKKMGAALKKKSTKEVKAYLINLLKQKHYLLAFPLSILLFRDHSGTIRTMLQSLGKYK